MATQGYLTGVDPAAIRQTLTPDEAINVSMTFTYDNTGNASVSYLIFVQDDETCPLPPSSHSWIPFSPASGSMPAEELGQTPISVPLNTTSLSLGTHVTNLCFVAQDPETPTNVAVPVILKSVATDDIYMDGFE